MPFDFYNFEHYSINYTNLFYDLNCIETFNNKNIQSKYLNMWIKILEYHDRAITKQLNSKEDIIKLEKLLQGEPEIFQLPMNYMNNTILLNFRVSVINKIISAYNLKPQSTPIDYYVKNDKEISWTPVDINVDFYSHCKEPIYIVPFLQGQHNFLVIDGNHRLTYKIKNKINDIQAIVFSEMAVIKFNLFPSTFDKFFYIMHNELNHMANATHYQNIDAQRLIKKSYLSDNKFKFM